jgi:hypothetical protein
MTEESLRTVPWSIEPLPKISRSCFGDFSRLRGQNRVPTPPAMMTAATVLMMSPLVVA